SCDPNWGGDECEIPKCYGKLANESTVCSSHGICVAPNNCSCDPNWGGDECEIPKCYGKLANEPSVCYGNGKCTSPNNCTCVYKFYGPQCQFISSEPSVVYTRFTLVAKK